MIKRYTPEKMAAIWSEENKYSYWLKVELAVCVAWQKLGKIPATALKKINSHAGFSVKRIEEIEKTVDHDVIAFLTSVAEKVGPESRFIHLGLTSSDLVDTALSLQLLATVDQIKVEMISFIGVLKKQARKYQATVMMGRTHGVHAEPMVFGLKFALWMEEMKRNLRRLEAAREDLRVGKFSGAVGTYSNLDPRVEVLACKTLGLVPDSVSNQVIQRDRHAYFMSVLAVIAGTLEKIATEVRGLQKTECNEAEEPFKKGQKGSSAMPHKKNPITCERVCGLARMVRANAEVSYQNMALWHERDISHSSTERVILPDSTILIDYMLLKMIDVIGNLVVHPDHMMENLKRGGELFFSQKLLLGLIGKGFTRENAYKLVQTNAMKAREAGESFRDVVVRDAEIGKRFSFDEINDIFDLKAYLENTKVIFKRLGI